MKFVGIEPKEKGRFINRYDITYETEDNTKKVYEMISRDRNLTTREELTGHPPDSVVLVMHNEAGDKILLNREFRMACGDFVYNFPAGLIDPGEDFLESAKRELWEETGLTLVEVKDILGESFSAIGFSNEKNMCVIGVAAGEFAESTSAVEEIQAAWYTREEVRELLKKEYFAARTQSYCYLWSRG